LKIVISSSDTKMKVVRVTSLKPVRVTKFELVTRTGSQFLKKSTESRVRPTVDWDPSDYSSELSQMNDALTLE